MTLPALRSADIGVSLGSGTDVAKEASALVLLDDSFAIIVHAIEEGRRIIDNLKKIISYLLGTGFSEIVVIAGALALALPLPLLPAQILWINIIEEGFMNFAFAFEPKEEGLMRRGPKGGGSAVLTSDVKKLVFILAGVTGAILTGLYFSSRGPLCRKRKYGPSCSLRLPLIQFSSRFPSKISASRSGVSRCFRTDISFSRSG